MPVIGKFSKKYILALQELITTGIEQGYLRMISLPAMIPEVNRCFIFLYLTRTGHLENIRLTTFALIQNTIDAYLRAHMHRKRLEKN
jgi:hypothetical protein